jgi:hypothetical protein
MLIFKIDNQREIKDNYPTLIFSLEADHRNLGKRQ